MPFFFILKSLSTKKIFFWFLPQDLLIKCQSIHCLICLQTEPDHYFSFRTLLFAFASIKPKQQQAQLPTSRNWTFNFITRFGEYCYQVCVNLNLKKQTRNDGCTCQEKVLCTITSHSQNSPASVVCTRFSLETFVAMVLFSCAYSFHFCCLGIKFTIKFKICILKPRLGGDFS